MALKVLRDNVLVAEKKKENKTESGLILQGDISGDTKIGVVLAVGPDVKYVKIGDNVIPEWANGRMAQFDGMQGVVFKEENIMGVVE
jgi:co-chaperonin GroES (HSP10)